MSTAETPQPSDAERFFEALGLDGAPGELVLFTLPDRASKWIDSLPAAIDYATERAKSCDVYFTVATHGRTPKTDRGSIESAAALLSLWVDIDVREGAHANRADLPTRAEAEKLLSTLPLTHSALVWSGGGFHAYWILREPFAIETPADRVTAARLSAGWQEFMRRKFAPYKVDATADLARVLRVPGTFNRKNGEALPVTLQNLTEARYNLDDFEPFLIAAATEPPRKGPVVVGETIPAGEHHNGLVRVAAKLARDGTKAPTIAAVLRVRIQEGILEGGEDPADPFTAADLYEIARSAVAKFGPDPGPDVDAPGDANENVPAEKKNGLAGIGPRMLLAIDVVESRIEWLWSRRIPSRYLTFIGGDPGVGKSHVAVDLAARLSVGASWPDCGRADAGAVLFLSSEDGLEDVLRPRLRVAGADLRRIGFLTGKFKPETPDVEFLLNLREDLAGIEAALPEWTQRLGMPVRLLIIDPFMNHMGIPNLNQEGLARPILAAVAAFFRRTGITGLGIRHLNKDEQKSLIYRGGGSLSFTGAARAEYFVGKNPDDESQRVLARVKGNLSLEPDSLLYEIKSSDPSDPDSPSKISWLGPTPLRADDIIAAGREKAGEGKATPQQDRAEELLLELLGEGRDISPADIMEKAGQLKIGKGAVYRASEKLGVVKRSRVARGPWFWSLAADVD